MPSPGHVVVIGQIHTLVGRREELLELLRETQAQAAAEPGCVSYAFAEVVGAPGHFMVTQEWRDEAAMEAHYRSQPFRRYQAAIGDFLARPSELRVHRVRETLKPEDGGPMDPRRAD